MVTIELYGVPRLRAGRARVTVDALTLSGALDGLAQVCPSLDGVLFKNGRAHPAYRLSLNGERFVSEPETPLASGDVLLVLSADVGG